MKARLLNPSRSSGPAETPGRGESGRIDEMIGALLEAVRWPGGAPSEGAVDPDPSRIDDRLETARPAEPMADPTGRELALYLVASATLVLIAIALGVTVGILSDRLLR